MRTWLVTGGAGFIGANLVLAVRQRGLARVVNLDALTYAGDRARLEALAGDPDHVFVQGDIRDRDVLAGLFATFRPSAVLHLAAESHVDRSIDGPEAFASTNVMGTLHLLEAARAHWESLPAPARAAFRFLHVSTDEVFGSLGPTGRFTLDSPYAPRSPYAASKAAADHLVGAWHATYGLPTLLTSCSNNYGPWQLPEKLIPLMVTKALRGEPLPVYGDGAQVREWLHVDDHVEALLSVLEQAPVGSRWLVGGEGECTNLTLVHELCAALDRERPQGAPHARHVTHVADRPGHDRRYALDASPLRERLGWRPRHARDAGLALTVRWYVEHQDWCERVRTGSYAGERLGSGRLR